MTFLEMSKKRYSVRQYASTPVEPEKLERILEAVRNAPTAHNAQPQRIFAMQSPEALADVDACTRGRFGAPLVLVICYDEHVSWKRKDYYDAGQVDCGIVGTHVMFAALEQGLGTCWVAMFNAAEMAKRLGLPDHVIPIAVMPVGYPAEGSVPYPYHDQRRLVTDLVVRK